jgi:integrase/recombinase XerD
MHAAFLDTQLVAYLSLHEALGFQLRAANILLPDFVACVKAQGITGPLRARLAFEWACPTSAARGSSGAARRLSMARGFLLYLRASAPDTDVPAPGWLPSPRRPTPDLYTPTQLTALVEAAQASRPHGSLRPHTLSTLIGL